LTNSSIISSVNMCIMGDFGYTKEAHFIDS
jgi:hypothetical protein